MSQEKREKPLNSYDFGICPTCGGTGWKTFWEGYPLMYREDIKLLFAESCPTCNGGLSERAETAKKHSDIPVVFYDADYTSFSWNIYLDNTGKTIDMNKKQRLTEHFLRNYREWKSEGYGLYIYSKTKGSGKTFLASCICNELMKLYGIKTRFVNASKLLEISQSGDKSSVDEYKREPIKLLGNCELLVLDDIGQKRTGNEWMNEIMFRIVDDRMTKNLVTIFTSNLTPEELPLDDRITERINKMSVAISLPEYNVRSREAYGKKVSFLKRSGLMKEGG